MNIINTFFDTEPQGESSEIEKMLGFRVKEGMVWVDGKETKGWSCPRIDHLAKAVEVIEKLLEEKQL
jgi:hypothetical protein